LRWAVAALAVLLLAAVGGLAALALRGDDPVPDAGETVVVTETAAETVTVTETEPAADDVLPDAVAGTRAGILAAAEAGDHDALAELAPDDFSYTFGGPVEGGPAAYWRELEQTTDERPLEILAALLRLPYTLHAGIYTWPFAFDTPPEELTDYERDLLAEAVDVDAAYAAGVGYAGWRTGIEPDGTWRFFIAGD
jgi:hypothetical protein